METFTLFWLPTSSLHSPDPIHSFFPQITLKYALYFPLLLLLSPQPLLPVLLQSLPYWSPRTPVSPLYQHYLPPLGSLLQYTAFTMSFPQAKHTCACTHTVIAAVIYNANKIQSSCPVIQGTPSLLNGSKSAFPYYFIPLSCRLSSHMLFTAMQKHHPMLIATPIFVLTSFPLWNAPHPNIQIIPIFQNAIKVSSPHNAFFDQLSPYWFLFPPNSLLQCLPQEFTNLAFIQNYLKCSCKKYSFVCFTLKILT